jgi:clan AA aspartic protease
MGYVRAKVVIADPEKTRPEEVDFLADSGAFFPIMSPSLAKKLEMKPIAEAELMLADRRKVKATLSNAYFKLLDREGVFQVAIMDVAEPLLGVTVLEGLGVKVDPSTGKLEYSRPYGLAIL